MTAFRIFLFLFSGLLLSHALGADETNPHAAKSLEQLLAEDVTPVSRDQVTIADPNPVISGPSVDTLVLPSVSRFGVGYQRTQVRMEEFYSGTDAQSTASVVDTYGEAMTRMNVDADSIYFAHRPNEHWMFHASLMWVRYSGIIETAAGDSSSLAVDGVSNLNLNVIRMFHLDPQTLLVFSLGFGIPTGSIDQSRDGVVYPYSLQTGSGTLDLAPGVTLVRAFDKWEAGLSAKADIHVGTNDRGYSLGNSVYGSAWLQYNPSPFLELGAYVNLSHTDAIDAVREEGPPRLLRDPENYGGTYLDLGLSAKIIHPSCPYDGKYFQIRGSKPVWKDANGIHLTKDWSVDFGIGFSF